MIRGLAGIVPARQMEVGRFYMAPAHQDGNWLFQCVQTSEPLDDGFRQKALFMTTGGKPDIGLYDLPTQTPIVALNDVHVRVDATSLAGSAFDTQVRPRMLLVRGTEAIICAPSGRTHGWQLVSVDSGRTLNGDLGHEWLTFTSWSLVMDDERGDELTIAEFAFDADNP